MRNSVRVVSLSLLVSVFGCSHAGSEHNGGSRDMSVGGTAVDMAFSVGGYNDLYGLGVLSGPLTITPLDTSIAFVTGQAVPTVQYQAYVGGVPTGAAWSIDQPAIGSINAGGLFSPTGNVAGKLTVTAVYGDQTVTTTLTVTMSITQSGDPGYPTKPATPGAGGYNGVGGNGAAPPPPNGTTTLDGPGTHDNAVSLLYPYDGTVWPRGMLAPLIQWNPGAHSFDSVKIDLKETNYEYVGYFGSNAPMGKPFMNVPIPQAAWDALTYSNGGEPVQVTVTFAQGANAFTGYTETWTVAQATMKGTIYYNSYGTSLVVNSDGSDHYGNQYGAGTLAIQVGTTPPTTSPVLIAGVPSPVAAGAKGARDGTGCRVCHTVSGDGKTLFTQASNSDASNYADTRMLDLTATPINAAGVSSAQQDLIFPALSKDGTLLFSNGATSPSGWSPGYSNLYSVATQTAVAGVTGLGTHFNAAAPSFSPDTQHVAFNFWSGTLTNGATTLTGDGRSLAILDFDGVKTFSNPRVLWSPTLAGDMTGEDLRSVWPSFLPTSTGIVFEREIFPGDFYGATRNGARSDLWWVDIATKQAHRLDQLNGFRADGSSYLPVDTFTGKSSVHPNSVDGIVNYEPTVNPIASGGYAWVVFTSRRMYGNVATIPPDTSDPRNYPWLDDGQVTPKKLWVAAIDLNAAPGSDPSHPAFYLPAQELHAGNSRGFWTIEKCAPDGTQNCVTGDECCGGYCQPSIEGGGGPLTCTSTKPTCSAEYEKCTQNSDCCGVDMGITCINNICSEASPPIQ